MAQLPKAVREAEKRAEEMVRRNAGEQEPGQETPPKAEQEPPEPPKESEPPKGEEPPKDTAKKEEKTVEELLAEADDDPPSAPDEEPGDDDGYRARYERLLQQHQTLQGKYNAEVPRLHRELRELREQVQTLQEKPPAAQEAAAQSIDESDEDFKALAEEWGDDTAKRILSMVNRQANSLVGNQVKQLDERIQQTSAQTQAEQERIFFRDLKREIPNWESINRHPAFHRWLAKEDGFSGESRQAALARHRNQLNLDGVTRIFSAFVDELRTGSSPSPDDPRQKHVQPGKAKAEAPSAAETHYTLADWRKLQAEVGRGKWRGKEAELERLEKRILKDINAA